MVVGGRACSATASDAAASGDADELGALIAAIGHGCRRSFTRVYETTHRQLLGAIQRLISQPADAEEVLQQVYTKLWLRSAQFDPARGRAIQWLKGIAHGAAVDAIKRKSRRPYETRAGESDDDDYDQFESPEAGPDDCFETNEAASRVRAQLLRLPVDQHRCVVLAFFGELTHAEIAQRLQCPLGTAKSHVRRGLLSMQVALQPRS